ncbi:MAG: DUF1844 domain-containing protein [Bdellovibrionaceae bacterium]|nr:DUF1844 domain-containing protein [Pseudobdellovibrionaceae bacterium]MDW8189612.1 DUF1844 domain-containing protein [Pseudobdellovibrionaceae bacterium]
MKKTQDEYCDLQADFTSLVSGIATQALINLGYWQDPTTKTTEVNLTFAKFNIDLLLVLQEKTENNLEAHERDLLLFVIQDLQRKFLLAKSSIS